MIRIIGLLGVLCLWSCSEAVPVAPTTPRAVSPRARRTEPLLPIPIVPSSEPRRVALGQRLFSEIRLSKTGNMSCATCHDLNRVGTDRDHHRIIDGLSFDTPTVFNAALNARLFWDGRAKTLEEQIDGPLLNPNEMGNTWVAALAMLRADPQYVTEFTAAFAEPPTEHNVKAAIAAFERSLLTVNAPFDRFLSGDRDAISADAQHGYALFKEYGCTSCHQGANVGGSMFERLGITSDYFQGRRGSSRDQGRAAVTGAPEDEHVFRVPSLRLAARTAPYLHDGSSPTLDATIELMGNYQLGVDIPAAERTQIASFLESLVGSYQGRQL
jgi:cytochrome c peroxidase